MQNLFRCSSASSANAINLTWPSMLDAGQYYDPAQQLCISVQACLATKPSPSPAPTSGAATAPAVTAATPAAAGTFTTTAGRKLLDSWNQRLMPLWQSSG